MKLKQILGIGALGFRHRSDLSFLWVLPGLGPFLPLKKWLQVCWECTWIPACTVPWPVLGLRLGSRTGVEKTGSTWGLFSTYRGLLEVINGCKNGYEPYQLGYGLRYGCYIYYIAKFWSQNPTRNFENWRVGCRPYLKQGPRLIWFQDAMWCKIFDILYWHLSS